MATDVRWEVISDLPRGKQIKLTVQPTPWDEDPKAEQELTDWLLALSDGLEERGYGTTVERIGETRRMI